MSLPTVYLVDGTGRVIYHTVSENINNDFSEYQLVGNLLGNMSGAERTRALRNGSEPRWANQNPAGPTRAPQDESGHRDGSGPEG